MTESFEPFRLEAMSPGHMPEVMHIQARCYSAIEPESLAAMEAKRVAGMGLAQVAVQRALVAGASGGLQWPASGSAPGPLGAYLIAMPIRWPDLPALNSQPEPALQPDTLYVHDLAILPQARGRGLGERLLQVVRERARGMGLRQSALVAIQGSVPFWERQGYVCVPTPEQLSEQLGSYGEAQLMVQPLTPPCSARTSVNGK